MFGDEPDLQFVGADYVADQQVVGAVVAGVHGLFGHGAGFLEDHFVSFEQARDLYRYFFAAARRTRNDGGFGDICGHGQTDCAEALNAFGNRVHEFVLFFVVLVEKQMQLVESVAGNLPMVFFVEVAKGDGVGEDLVQIFGAFDADGLIERNRKLGKLAVGLNFSRVLMKNRARTFGSGLRVRLVIGLGISLASSNLLEFGCIKRCEGNREY